MHDAWTSVELSRHPERPRPAYFVDALIDGLVELRGDRVSVDDPGIYTGIGRFLGQRLAVAAYRPDRGDAGAGGLRKVMRLVSFAERFQLPLVTFIDVVGRHPTDAPHGPMWPAVGQTLERLMQANVPTVAVLVGEGVSGGALALCATDRLIALENAYLAANAPEAVAGILWRDANRAQDAARLLRLTTDELVRAGLCDAVVPEGAGAHTNPQAICHALKSILDTQLTAACSIDPAQRCMLRQQRFVAKEVWGT